MNLSHRKYVKKSFCGSQSPHKFVNLSFNITNIRNEMTDLCENRLVQNDFINTFCEIRTCLGTHPRFFDEQSVSAVGAIDYVSGSGN